MLYLSVTRVTLDSDLHSVHLIIHSDCSFNSRKGTRRCSTSMCSSRMCLTLAWAINRRGNNPRLLKSASLRINLLIRYWFRCVNFLLHVYCPNAPGNVYLETRLIFNPCLACYSLLPFFRMDRRLQTFPQTIPQHFSDR